MTKTKLEAKIRSYERVLKDIATEGGRYRDPGLVVRMMINDCRNVLARHASKPGDHK